MHRLILATGVASLARAVAGSAKLSMAVESVIAVPIKRRIMGRSFPGDCRHAVRKQIAG